MLGLDYAEQLKQKEAAVRKLVGKYGPVAPIRGAENPCHYRNKVISTFAAGPGGKLVSGIYAAGTHKVLPVESCLLQDEVLDTVMQAVRAAASACRYQPYNEDKGTGLLRHCLLRRGVVSGQVMVVLVTAQPVLPGAKNFVRAHQTRKIRTCFRLEKGSDFSFSSGITMKAPVDGAKLRYLVIDRKPLTKFGGCDYEVRCKSLFVQYGYRVRGTAAPGWEKNLH